ncbi:MAG: hypothetical protein IJP86_01255 [Synergistaceae bacterium]|nr:hypothetical protein [Synergistaceae bacterium]
MRVIYCEGYVDCVIGIRAWVDVGRWALGVGRWAILPKYSDTVNCSFREVLS